MTHWILASLLAMMVGAAQAAGPLSVADVESATGIKGIKEVAKDPAKGAGGAQNFARADGSLVLLVMLEPMSTLKVWQQRYGKCEKRAELGPDGCVAKDDPTFGFILGYAYFSKSNHAVWLQQMGNQPGNVKKPNIDRPTLIRLAQLASSKL